MSGILEDVMRFEVNDFFQVDINVLKGHDTCPELFRKPVGRCEITTDHVAKAPANGSGA